MLYPVNGMPANESKQLKIYLKSWEHWSAHTISPITKSSGWFMRMCEYLDLYTLSGGVFFLVSWCFEPSQSLGIISGLSINFNPSLTYSARRSFKTNHSISTAQLKYRVCVSLDEHSAENISLRCSYRSGRLTPWWKVKKGMWHKKHDGLGEKGKQKMNINTLGSIWGCIVTYYVPNVLAWRKWSVIHADKNLGEQLFQTAQRLQTRDQ